MLGGASIELLVDVRRFPGSRRQPQFSEGALRAALSNQGIDYRHLMDLGGRRTARLPDSPNVGWRVEAFNAYADHMQSEEFRSALADLESHAAASRTAIMCSEAVPWRCHRRLIADALSARGWNVLDIYSPTQVKEHRMTDFAQVDRGEVTYPAEKETHPLFE